MLACMSTLPDSTWPCLTGTGRCSRHRTWYQWVSGSVGAVDSQTVAPLPMKATSNQKASPCTVPDWVMWNSTGISIRCSSDSSAFWKSMTCRWVLARQMRMSKVST